MRLKRRGKEHTRFFPDRRFGSRSLALEAALRYRDCQLLALHPPVRVRRFFGGNKTGEVGVFLERRRVAGRIYPRYVAQWPTGKRPGQWKRRAFSVIKHGAVKAFALAVSARHAGVEALERRARRELADLVGERRRTAGDLSQLAKENVEPGYSSRPSNPSKRSR